MAPIWKRVFVMPFSPALWWQAREWAAGSVLGPILLLTVLLGLGLGLYRGFGTLRSFNEQADKYDASFDPILIDNGQVSVMGPRIVNWVEGDRTLLVDPDGTVPDELIKTGERIVVRKNKILSDSRPAVDVPDLMKMAGVEHVRIDGASMREWSAKWGNRLVLGVTALIVLVDVLGELLTCLLYALVAAAIVANVKKLAFGASYSMAMATLSLKPVIGTGLALAGTGVDTCLGLLVWPAAATLLSVFAVIRSAPASAVPVPPQP